MFPTQFNILQILPSPGYILLNGLTRTQWFRDRVHQAMQAANTKRCDACGCSNRMNEVVPATPSPLEVIRHRSRLMSTWRRLFFPNISPFTGGTESSGPC